jgi:short-subunit dehydrogenase
MNNMMKFRCLMNVLCVKHQFYRSFFSSSNINSNGKYIFISGCDTVFSHTLAVHFDRQGFHVFAGVYDLKSKFLLKNQLSTRATIFPIDITRLEDVNNTYDLIKKETNSLHALINNVDVSTINLLERNSMEFMLKKMNLYFFGHVSMTKTFLPLLTSKRDSSIVNICSVNGILDLPLESTYHSMKYALKSFSDSLRYDMAPWNLRVSIIEADSIPTSRTGEHEKLWDKFSMNVRQRWDEDFLKNQIKQLIDHRFNHTTEHPLKVVQTHQNAVENTKSRSRYRPNWSSKFDFFPVAIASAWLTDNMLQIKNISRFLSNEVKKQVKDYKLFKILNPK